MFLILFIWACIGCAILVPFPISLFILLSAAALRILYLTHASLIEAGAEAIGETQKLAGDVRRNAPIVIKTVIGWGTALAALATVVVYFQIPF